jgi:hypothetical protein
MFSTLLAASSLVVLATAQVPTTPSPVFIKTGVDPTYCLGTLGSANNDAVAVLLCNVDDANQKWSFANGTVSVNGNMCLDVTDGSDVDGAKLQVYSCTEGNTNQQWYYTGDNRFVPYFPLSEQLLTRFDCYGLIGSRGRTTASASTSRTAVLRVAKPPTQSLSSGRVLTGTRTKSGTPSPLPPIRRPHPLPKLRPLNFEDCARELRNDS